MQVSLQMTNLRLSQERRQESCRVVDFDATQFNYKFQDTGEVLEVIFSFTIKQLGNFQLQPVSDCQRISYFIFQAPPFVQHIYFNSLNGSFEVLVWNHLPCLRSRIQVVYPTIGYKVALFIPPKDYGAINCLKFIYGNDIVYYLFSGCANTQYVIKPG